MKRKGYSHSAFSPPSLFLTLFCGMTTLTIFWDMTELTENSQRNRTLSQHQENLNAMIELWENLVFDMMKCKIFQVKDYELVDLFNISTNKYFHSN